MDLLIKFIVLINVSFFSYVFYLSMNERKKFFNSSEYETSSLFEKIVLNTVSFFGFSFFILMFISYLIFIISEVVIKIPF